MKTAIIAIEDKQVEEARRILQILPKQLQDGAEIWNGQLSPDYTDENLNVLEKLYRERSPQMLIFCGGYQEDELAIRLGYRLGTTGITQIRAIICENNQVKTVRGAYSSNMEAAYQFGAEPVVLSMNKSAIPKTLNQHKIIEMIQIEDTSLSKSPEWLLESEILEVEEKDDLEEKEFVIAGGKGLGNKAGFQELIKTADRLGAATAASRSAALNGWISLEKLLGQSGTQISPKVCLVIGVSGAAPFLEGIQASDFVIAVNNDADAPIFQAADVGIIADSIKFLEALNQITDTIQK